MHDRSERGIFSSCLSLCFFVLPNNKLLQSEEDEKKKKKKKKTSSRKTRVRERRFFYAQTLARGVFFSATHFVLAIFLIAKRLGDIGEKLIIGLNGSSIQQDVDRSMWFLTTLFDDGDRARFCMYGI